MKLTAELVNKACQRMNHLRSLGQFADSDRIRTWLVGEEGVTIEIERDGSIFWWYRKERGVALQKSLKTERQQWALDHLLGRTYEFRKPLTLNALHIEGDPSYLPKDKLMDILLGEKSVEVIKDFDRRR